MKYLAALFIGIGLLAHNPASAETLKFGDYNEYVAAPMEECIEASERGLQLEERKFLIRGIKMGVTWRLYEIFYYEAMYEPAVGVSCGYRDLISRTT